jgi:biotin transport system substrate-specific component
MQIKAQRLTRMALLLAIVIVLGLIPAIPIGIIPVPLTVQNIGILLIGLMLTPFEAFLTTGLFLLLALIGLPILTGLRGGVAVFIGPTGGYLLGYWVGAVLLAWWSQKQRNEWFMLFAKIAIVAVLIIDLFGSVGFAVNTHIPIIKAFALNAILIPGDIIKAALIAVIARKFK